MCVWGIGFGFFWFCVLVWRFFWWGLGVCFVLVLGFFLSHLLSSVCVLGSLVACTDSFPAVAFHRMIEVERDLCRSSCPTPLLKQGHLLLMVLQCRDEQGIVLLKYPDLLLPSVTFNAVY